jgi:PKD repeat protein
VFAYNLDDDGYSEMIVADTPKSVGISPTNGSMFVPKSCSYAYCTITVYSAPTIPDEYAPEIILFTAEGYTKPAGENFTLNFLFDATLPVEWTITTSDQAVDDNGTIAAEPMEGTSTISFAVAGTYTCKLVITNAYGTAEATLELVVFTPVGPEDGPDPIKLPPVAYMGADVWGGAHPLTVSFEDWSTGEVETWLWDFGDGDTSDNQNPTHEYAEEGIYMARLTITAGPWTSTCTHSIVVCDRDPSEWPPIIDDIYAQDNWGVAPFTTIVVGDVVGAVSSWLWDFGDGITCTTPEEVEHTWESPGTYTVKLTVTNIWGSTSATFEIIVLYWGAIDSDLGSGYYILDTRNDRVLVYQRDGTYLKHFGRTGALGGQLNYPTGMAAFNAQKYDGKIRIQ